MNTNHNQPPPVADYVKLFVDAQLDRLFNFRAFEAICFPLTLAPEESEYVQHNASSRGFGVSNPKAGLKVYKSKNFYKKGKVIRQGQMMSPPPVDDDGRVSPGSTTPYNKEKAMACSSLEEVVNAGEKLHQLQSRQWILHGLEGRATGFMPDRAVRQKWAEEGAAMTKQALELELEQLTSSLDEAKGKIEEAERALNDKEIEVERVSSELGQVKSQLFEVLSQLEALREEQRVRREREEESHKRRKQERNESKKRKREEDEEDEGRVRRGNGEDDIMGPLELLRQGGGGCDAEALVKAIRRQRLPEEEVASPLVLPPALRVFVESSKRTLSKALEKLSYEVYTHRSRFLFEMIQNADDNTYSRVMDQPGAVPTLEVELWKGRSLLAYHNEDGFTGNDVYSICQLGESFKQQQEELGGAIHSDSSRLIGRKGVGFKSIFALSSRPLILSPPYFFRFDTDQHGPYGMIVPEWVNDAKSSLPIEHHHWLERVGQGGGGGGTCVYLPLKTGVTEDLLLGEDVELDGLTLAFLRHLRKLELRSMHEDQHGNVIRKDRIVEASSEEEEVVVGEEKGMQYEYLVGRMEGGLKRHAVSNWVITDSSIVTPRRYRLHSFTLNKPSVATTITLAFPLEGGGGNEEGVFAWLPINKAGFRFALHADFDLTTNRQDLSQTSGWNHWLLHRVPLLYLLAMESDRTYLGGQKTDEFMPRMTEVRREAMWKDLARAIIRTVKEHSYVMTEDGEEVPRGKAYQRPPGLTPELVSNKLLKEITQGNMHLAQAPSDGPVSSYTSLPMLPSMAILSCLEALSENSMIDWDGLLKHVWAYLLATQNQGPPLEPEARSRIIDRLPIFPIVPCTDHKRQPARRLFEDGVPVFSGLSKPLYSTTQARKVAEALLPILHISRLTTTKDDEERGMLHALAVSLFNMRPAEERDLRDRVRYMATHLGPPPVFSTVPTLFWCLCRYAVVDLGLSSPDQLLHDPEPELNQDDDEKHHDHDHDHDFSLLSWIPTIARGRSSCIPLCNVGTGKVILLGTFFGRPLTSIDSKLPPPDCHLIQLSGPTDMTQLEFEHLVVVKFGVFPTEVPAFAHYDRPHLKDVQQMDASSLRMVRDLVKAYEDAAVLYQRRYRHSSNDCEALRTELDRIRKTPSVLGDHKFHFSPCFLKSLFQDMGLTVSTEVMEAAERFLRIDRHEEQDWARVQEEADKCVMDVEEGDGDDYGELRALLMDYWGVWRHERSVWNIMIALSIMTARWMGSKRGEGPDDGAIAIMLSSIFHWSLQRPRGDEKEPLEFRNYIERFGVWVKTPETTPYPRLIKPQNLLAAESEPTPSEEVIAAYMKRVLDQEVELQGRVDTTNPLRMASSALSAHGLVGDELTTALSILEWYLPHLGSPEAVSVLIKNWLETFRNDLESPMPPALLEAYRTMAMAQEYYAKDKPDRSSPYQLPVITLKGEVVDIIPGFWHPKDLKSGRFWLVMVVPEGHPLDSPLQAWYRKYWPQRCLSPSMSAAFLDMCKEQLGEGQDNKDEEEVWWRYWPLLAAPLAFRNHMGTSLTHPEVNQPLADSRHVQVLIQEDPMLAVGVLREIPRDRSHVKGLWSDMERLRDLFLREMDKGPESGNAHLLQAIKEAAMACLPKVVKKSREKKLVLGSILGVPVPKGEDTDKEEKVGVVLHPMAGKTWPSARDMNHPSLLWGAIHWEAFLLQVGLCPPSLFQTDTDTPLSDQTKERIFHAYDFLYSKRSRMDPWPPSHLQYLWSAIGSPTPQPPAIPTPNSLAPAPQTAGSTSRRFMGGEGGGGGGGRSYGGGDEGRYNKGSQSYHQRPHQPRSHSHWDNGGSRPHQQPSTARDHGGGACRPTGDRFIDPSVPPQGRDHQPPSPFDRHHQPPPPQPTPTQEDLDRAIEVGYMAERFAFENIFSKEHSIHEIDWVSSAGQRYASETGRPVRPSPGTQGYDDTYFRVYDRVGALCGQPGTWVAIEVKGLSSSIQSGAFKTFLSPNEWNTAARLRSRYCLLVIHNLGGGPTSTTTPALKAFIPDPINWFLHQGIVIASDDRYPQMNNLAIQIDPSKPPPPPPVQPSIPMPPPPPPPPPPAQPGYYY